MNTNFQDSHAYKSIHKHYETIKEKSVRIKETELPLLQAIMANGNFEKIQQTFCAVQEYFGCQLKNADRTLIELKVSQMESQKEQNERISKKLQLSIQRLEETIFSLQQYNSLVISKFNWLQSEIRRYEESLTDIREEIDIVKSQNQKLKINKKGIIKQNNSQQLKGLLKEYRCSDKPFPRNKTEALMLINRIQSMIQQAQMKKLSNYMLQS